MHRCFVQKLTGYIKSVVLTPCFTHQETIFTCWTVAGEADRPSDQFVNIHSTYLIDFKL